jgi:ABC-2 type transport system permease protein
MTTLQLELRLALHSRLAAGALVLLLLLTALAVWSGLHAVSTQRDALARIAAVQRDDVAAVAEKYRDGGEAGYAAYSTPHLTVNPPAPLAFAAIGQRDVQPYALRVRLLGLHSQLYESESINPELAAAGRFDFAFVLVYLAPLFVIALMHDLVSGEREAGRLRLVNSLPMPAARLWRRRIALRFGLVLAALLLPFALGAAIAGAGLTGAVLVAACAALYLAFWFGIAAAVAALVRTSAAGAAVLLAVFVVLTLVLPTFVNGAIGRAVPVSKGAELALAQRQEVHNGWDLPKGETMMKFFRTNPEWRDTAPVTGRFHWKWYYAMQQAGDDAVAGRAGDYRAALMAREDWTRASGWLLPSVAVQVLLHRLADTDLQGQLGYQDRVAAFHTQLRRFFYPYIFNDRPFGPAEFAQLPAYNAVPALGGVAVPALAALALLAGAGLAAGAMRLGRVQAL